MKTTALVEYDASDVSNMLGRETYSTEVKTSAAELVAKMSGNLAFKHYQAKSSEITNMPDEVVDQGEAQILEKTLHVPKLRPVAKKKFVSFTPLQEWEGYVIDIQDDCFTARLVDLTAGTDIGEEEADFPIEDLSSGDLRLLKIGAVFRWMIGYQRSKGGSKQRVSQVVFRDLPQWTKSELESSREKAARLSSSIEWD